MKPSKQKHRRVFEYLQKQQKKRDLTKPNVRPFTLFYVGVIALVFFFSVTVVGMGLFGMGTASAAAGINQEMSFEGKIVNSSGTNITDGTYNMEFKVYSGCTNEPTNNTGCTLVWTEDYLVGQSDGVPFVSGTYAVNLGQYCPFSGGACTPTAANDGNTNSGVNWDTYPLYLSLQIGSTSSCSPSTNNFQAACGGDGEMNPYVLLTSTPYAFNSNELGGMTSSQFGQLATNQTWTGTNTFQAATTVQAASTTALQVENGSTPLLTADTTDSMVQVGNTTVGTSPSHLYLSDVSTNAGGNALITGQWENSNSWGIGSNSNSSTDNAIRIGVISSNNGNAWNNSTNINLFVTGTETVKPTTSNDSATAFQVQNAAGNQLLDVNSSAGTVAVGSSSHVNGDLVLNNSTNSNTLQLISGVTAANGGSGYSITMPTGGGSGAQCLQSTSGSTTAATTLQFGSCSSGGISALGTVDGAGTTNADGATISGSTLYLNSADGTHPGVLNATTQAIGGQKTFSSLVTGSAGITTSGGAVSLTGNAASSLTTSSGALTLTSAATATWGTSAGSLTLQANGTSTLSLDTTGAGTVGLGNTSAGTIDVGNTTTGTAVSIQGGTGGISLLTGNNGSGTAGSVSIDTGTSSSGSGTINIGTTNAQAINIGTAALASGTKTITIGSYGSTQAPDNIYIGDNSPGSGAGQQTIVIGSSYASGDSTTIWGGTTGATYGAISLLTGSSVNSKIGIGNNAVTTTVQIGTTATNTLNTQTINIGNTAAAGTTNVSIGSTTGATGGSTTVQAVSTLALGNAVSTAINIQGASGGTISLGNNGVANTVQIGQSGTSAVTQSVYIGNGGAGSTTNVTLGNANGGTTTIQGGVGVVDESTTNSTTAFQIQNSNGASGILFNADASNMRISIGSVGTATGQLYVAGNVATSILKSQSITGGSQVWGIRVVGNYAYVLSDNGASSTLKTYDVSNPASPSLVGSAALAAGNGNTGGGIAVAGKYAYVAESSATNEIEIFDISNPDAPNSVATATTTSAPKAVYVQGRYLYTVEGNFLQVFDISNPLKPVSLGTTAAGTGPQDVFVQGRYAYVTDYSTAGFLVFDISNPASPSNVGSVATPSTTLGKPYDVFVQGRYAYITNNETTGTGVHQTMQIIDVSNPASPTVAGTSAQFAGGGPAGIYVQGRYAYMTTYNTQTFVTLDVSNPASPTVLGSALSLGGSSGPNDVVVQGRYAYIADGSQADFQVVDLGGEYAQQLQAGGVETGTLQVDSNATVSGDTNLAGGLTVGGNTELNGDTGINSAATTGTAVGINANGLTSGTGVNIATTSALQTAGSLLNVSNTATLTTNSGSVSEQLVNVSRSLTANVTGGTTAEAISHASGFPGGNTNGSTQMTSLTSVVPAHVGDLLLLTINIGSDGAGAYSVSALSSTITGTWTKVNTNNDSTTGNHTELWYAVATSTSSGTINVTYTGTKPSPWTWEDMAIDSFTASGSPTWNIITSNFQKVDTSSLTLTYPQLAATKNLQAYWGNSEPLNSASNGTTSGFTFVNATNPETEVAYDTSLTSGNNYQPTASQSPSGTSDATGVIFEADVAGGGSETVSGPVATFSNNCTLTSGNCNDASNVMLLNQQYSGAAGAVLEIQNSGSGAGLQIQNGTSGNIFTVNTSSAQIVLGAGSNGENSPTILVLDNSTSASDPTGVSGAMYYNAKLGEYRCYNGTYWLACQTSPITSGWSVEDDFMSGGTTSGTIGTLGWALSGTGATIGGYNLIGGAASDVVDHPGEVDLKSTASTAGDGANILLAGSGTNDPSAYMEVGEDIRLSMVQWGGDTTADIISIAGLDNYTGNSTLPTKGVYFQADTAVSADWEYCFNTTCAPTGWALSSNIGNNMEMEIHINSLGTGTSSVTYTIGTSGTAEIPYTVNGATIDSATAPADAVSPQVGCDQRVADANGAQCNVDYYQFSGLVENAPVSGSTPR